MSLALPDDRLVGSLRVQLISRFWRQDRAKGFSSSLRNTPQLPTLDDKVVRGLISKLHVEDDAKKNGGPNEHLFHEVSVL